jgi:hypothetical protein
MRSWIIRLPLGLLLLTLALLIAAVLATAHGLQAWSQATLPVDVWVNGHDVGAGLQQQAAQLGLGATALVCLAALALVWLAVALPLLLLAGLVLGAVALVVAVVGAPLLALALVALLLAPMVGLALLLRWLLR